jgi:hypothetical protein
MKSIFKSIQILIEVIFKPRNLNVENEAYMRSNIQTINDDVIKDVNCHKLTISLNVDIDYFFFFFFIRCIDKKPDKRSF